MLEFTLQRTIRASVRGQFVSVPQLTGNLLAGGQFDSLVLQTIRLLHWSELSAGAVNSHHAPIDWEFTCWRTIRFTCSPDNSAPPLKRIVSPSSQFVEGKKRLFFHFHNYFLTFSFLEQVAPSGGHCSKNLEEKVSSRLWDLNPRPLLLILSNSFIPMILPLAPPSYIMIRE